MKEMRELIYLQALLKKEYYKYLFVILLFLKATWHSLPSIPLASLIRNYEYTKDFNFP